MIVCQEKTLVDHRTLLEALLGRVFDRTLIYAIILKIDLKGLPEPLKGDRSRGCKNKGVPVLFHRGTGAMVRDALIGL